MFRDVLGHLGTFWTLRVVLGHLGTFWRYFGTFWYILRQFRTLRYFLAHFCGVLGGVLGHVGTFWNILGRFGMF